MTQPNQSELTVAFKAFYISGKASDEALRIVVPKDKYYLGAEDSGCYYLRPVVNEGDSHVLQKGQE